MLIGQRKPRSTVRKAPYYCAYGMHSHRKHFKGDSTCINTQLSVLGTVQASCAYQLDICILKQLALVLT